MFVIRIPGGANTEMLDSNRDLHDRITQLSDGNQDNVFERVNKMINAIDLNGIKTIIDVGSAHGAEAADMARLWPDAMIYGFEPLPRHYDACAASLASLPAELSNRMRFEQLAANDTTGQISFYAIDETQSNNGGMSSKFKLVDPKFLPWENNVQKEITVDAVRLDEWCSKRHVYPDLIWMDAQGAELDILRGAEGILDTVKVIMTEAGVKPYYEGHNLKPDIDAWLQGKGFVELAEGRKINPNHPWEIDTIYVRK
jgi:FkbM family methyltransferase